jgi:hypothetical protein
MNLNTTIDIDGAQRVGIGPRVSPDPRTLRARVKNVGIPSDLDPMAALELMRELEQRLRVASLRIAIEGDDLNGEVLEALARLSALVEQKLS